MIHYIHHKLTANSLQLTVKKTVYSVLCTVNSATGRSA